MDHVTFVGVFFLLVLLVVTIYYATMVVPPVRTLGKEKQPDQMVEYNYTTQFAPLLGYRIRPVDFSSPSEGSQIWPKGPEKKLYDASGNLL